MFSNLMTHTPFQEEVGLNHVFFIYLRVFFAR